MNKTELSNIIREIVRSELKNLGPELVREALLESLQGRSEIPTLTEKRRPAAARSPYEAKPVKELKQYSTDPILNKILNETAGGVPQELGTTVPDFGAEMMTEDVPVPPTFPTNISREALNENKDLAAVAKALTRDYRSVLRAADEKAKRNYRP